MRFENRTLSLSDGRTLEIREARPSDAAALLAHVEIVCAETDFLTFGPGEFGVSVAEEEGILRSFQGAPNQIFLIARIGGVIVGSLAFLAGQRPRVRHAGEFGVSVRKTHWGLGVGSALLDALVEWARGTGELTKISLRVRTDNERAIRLYERKGFEHEGVVRRDLRIDGEYFDHALMGLLL